MARKYQGRLPNVIIPLSNICDGLEKAYAEKTYEDAKSSKYWWDVLHYAIYNSSVLSEEEIDNIDTAYRDMGIELPKKEVKENNAVNHPTHYTSHPSGVECIQITEHMNFNTGNAMEYLWRAGLKADAKIQDLEKAKFYVDREIERLKKEQK